jgi:hypothetical protein
MDTPVTAHDAAAALAHVQERQSAVADTVTVPGWYWAAIAALVVGFTAGVESGRTPIIIAASVAFAAGLAACVAVATTGRRVQASNALLGVRGAGLITGFVLLTVAASLATSFGLDAAGVPWSATLGSLVTAALLVVGGPLLLRGLQRVMQAAATRTATATRA